MSTFETPVEQTGKKAFLATACSLFLLFWMADAFLSSFYSLYFIENELDATQQSILLGIIPLALFLGCLVLSPIAKDSRRALYLFRICAALEAGLSFAFVFCHSFWALLPVTFLLGFFNGAPFPFIEGFIAPRAKAYGTPYSFVRMFGTAGYIVSLVIGYFVLSHLPVRDCYYFSGALFTVALAVSFLIHGKTQQIEEEQIPENPANKTKIISKTFVIFLLSMLFLYGAFTAMSYLLPVRLKVLGLSDADYSLVRGVGIVAELITMLLIPLFAKRIRRYKTPILIAAIVCLAASSCGIFIENSYGLAYSALILSGIGKGFLFAYQALLLQDIVGKERLAAALTINTAITNMTAAALNLLSSTIYTNLGFPAYFGIISGMELIGVVLIFFIRVKQPQEKAA